MEMKGVNRLFVDTNVLVYATKEGSPWYQLAVHMLAAAKENGVILFISPQILREYISAATRKSETNPTILFEQVIENLRIFQAELKILEENQFVVSHLIDLIEMVSVSGKQIHDANIVVTMVTHHIPHLLTHNVRDFSRFSHLITIFPLEE